MKKNNQQQAIVQVIEDRSVIDRGGYEVPIYECNGRHYFLDSIPVAEIERDEDAQPRPYNDAAGQKIAESVRRKVIMQPVLCRWDATTGKFLVTEGQHRWRAFKDLLQPEGISGADRIPAIVYVDMEKRTALQCGIEANAEDRARGLSGKEMAKKAASILETTRADLANETGRDPKDISEEEIFNYLGKRNKSEQKKYLIGDMVQQMMEDGEAKITPYLSDRTSKHLPVTVKNFEFFLGRLTYLQALGAENINLRADQYENVKRLTNMFVEKVLGDRWTPDQDPPTASHKHARNICRRHPFEALGYFMAKVLDRYGGNEATVGAAWAKTEDIDWAKVEKALDNLLMSHVWDEPETYTCRNIDEIKSLVAQVITI